MIDSIHLPIWPLLASALGLFAPFGIALITFDEENLRPMGLLSIASILITVIGYAATGFAVHFGGIGIIIDHPDVAALVWEWTPLKGGALAFWGASGWMGFGMDEAQTPLAALLFLSTLPLTASVVVLALGSLWHRVSSGPALLFAALTALFFAPLVGNWTQGGGWLMHLGDSLGAGDGYLDFGGASFFFLAGGVAAAALLAFRREVYNTNLTNVMSAKSFYALGVVLLAVSGVGLLIASPLHLWEGSSPIQGALNGLLALSAGGLIGMAYSWFLFGEPAAIWIARSAAAGWVAVLAGVVWMSPLQAMLIGAVAAWLFIIASWGVRELLHWYDPGGIFSVFGLPAMWGGLAVGFFAPTSGQFLAQFIGVASIFLFAFFSTSVFLVLVLLFHHLLKTGVQPEKISDTEPDTLLSKQ